MRKDIEDLIASLNAHVKIGEHAKKLVAEITLIEASGNNEDKREHYSRLHELLWGKEGGDPSWMVLDTDDFSHVWDQVDSYADHVAGTVTWDD